jgi:hypothetical protein
MALSMVWHAFRGPIPQQAVVLLPPSESTLIDRSDGQHAALPTSQTGSLCGQSELLPQQPLFDG